MMQRLLAISIVLAGALPVLAQEHRQYPTVALVLLNQQFDEDHIRDMEKKLDKLRDKKDFEADFVISEGRPAVEDWDYVVTMRRFRDFAFSECGFNRTHYEWDVFNSRESLLDSGHTHGHKNAAEDVFKAVRRFWDFERLVTPSDDRRP